MRKLKLIEHISLDGVIQASGKDDFRYSDWTAPYRTPAGLATISCGTRPELRSAAWPANLRYLVGFLA